MLEEEKCNRKKKNRESQEGLKVPNRKKGSGCRIKPMIRVCSIEKVSKDVNEGRKPNIQTSGAECPRQKQP